MKRPLTNFDPSEIKRYQKAIDGSPQKGFTIGVASTFDGTAQPSATDLCLYVDHNDDCTPFWNYFDSLES